MVLLNECITHSNSHNQRMRGRINILIQLSSFCEAAAESVQAKVRIYRTYERSIFRHIFI